MADKARVTSLIGLRSARENVRAAFSSTVTVQAAGFIPAVVTVNLDRRDSCTVDATGFIPAVRHLHATEVSLHRGKPGGI